MAQRKRRGFTIVELVIVIAVIAILAGVLIPTFVSVIKKANESADIQAVRQMNTHLANSKVLDGVDNIADVITALNKEKIDLDNYKPLTSGRMFYWYKTANRILYVDENEGVIFPEEYKGLNLANEKGTLYSLSGEIKFNDYTISESKEVSISNAGQFASLMNDYNKNNGDAKSVAKVTLTQDIDFAGSTYKFNGGAAGYTGNIEIDGGGHTIYGLRDDTNSIFGSGEFSSKGYGYGLFSIIAADATVTIKNVIISGMVVGDSLQENGTMGLIAGYLYGSLVMENVTIKDCRVEGLQKIGGIVGRNSGSLEMKNVTMTNVDVVGGGQVAKIAGFVDEKCSKLVCENVDVSGVNVSMSDKWFFTIKERVVGTDITLNGVAQSGKLYAILTYSGWEKTLFPILTDELYWRVSTGGAAQYKGSAYSLSEISSSENITK